MTREWGQGNEHIQQATLLTNYTTSCEFARSLLRIETVESCTDLHIRASLNGEQLKECEYEGVELFPPVAQNAGYATRDRVKFFAVPLDSLIPGRNKISLENFDHQRAACKLFSLELALYR